MRGLMLVAALAAILTVAAPQPATASFGSAGSTISASTTSDLQQNPVKDVDVNININRGGGAWYRSPIWIAIFAIGGVVILLMIVLVARGGGGGTTIVRE
jgi:hypothetical protein